jgi:hypothetical protein
MLPRVTHLIHFNQLSDLQAAVRYAATEAGSTGKGRSVEIGLQRRHESFEYSRYVREGGPLRLPNSRGLIAQGGL